MKKLLLTMTALLATAGAMADVTPEEGKEYYLQVADEACTSEMYMNVKTTVYGQSDGAGQCLFLSANKEVACFTQAEGGWYISNADGTYLVQASHGVRPSQSGDAEKSIFVIETVDNAEGTFKLRVLDYNGDNNYFGARNSGNKYGQWGCVVFCNRSAENAYLFKLIEKSPRRILQDLLGTAIEFSSSSDKVGGYSAACYADVLAVISAIEAKLEGEPTEEDVTTLQALYQTALESANAAIAASERIMPEPGKFYQLATWKTVNAGKVAFAKTDNKCYWGMNDTPASVWVFEAAADGEYYLKNLSTGCYMNNYTSNAGGGADPNVLVESKQSVAVVASNNGRKVGVKVGNNGNNIYYLDRDQNNADANGCKPVCRWSDNAIPTGDNRMWLINEVNPSDIKHTLSVGAAGWATLVLGFNAAIPTTEDVTVYAVESTTTTSATLKPVTGVLPANTAVLVNAPANSTVEFAYTEETASVSSLLEGTLYDKNITPEAGYTCYVLSMQNNAVGFYKAALNQENNAAFKNNANKVYLPVATENGAPSLSFVFDTETGIEGVGAAKVGKSAIHDLSGRRVKSAQKGIYIINGKKIVK